MDRKSRILTIALLFVLAFFFYTTHDRMQPVSDAASSWISRPTHVELTEAAAPPQLDPDEQNNIAVYRRVLPSVVSVASRSVQFDFFYGEIPQEGLGSGFIVDRQGHILTNYHVVAGARQIEVTTSDKKKYRATIVGLDKVDDLAVIQIQGEKLEPATLGDSHNLEVGQKVYAIGNPFGLSGSMTRGIISSLRPVRGPNGVAMDEAIQTDAAVNPGNSGGPLLNSRGDVIGINSFILSPAGQSAGLGFAIPVNVAKAVVSDLITYGEVRRPSLGVRTLPIGPELADQLGLAADSGLLVVQVVPGSGAEVAGLRAGNQPAYFGNVQIMIGGDLITEVDGKEVQDQADLAHLMNGHHSGDRVRVTLYRGRRRLEVNVILGEASRGQA